MVDNRTNLDDTVKTRDFLQDVLCATAASSFHHVLSRFPEGLRADSILRLFGNVLLGGTIQGLNVFVAEVKLMTALSGAWDVCVASALLSPQLCGCAHCCPCTLLTAAVDQQTEVDAMMRKYGIGGTGRLLCP